MGYNGMKLGCNYNRAKIRLQLGNIWATFWLHLANKWATIRQNGMELGCNYNRASIRVQLGKNWATIRLQLR